jgi:hypothetical protein
MFIVEMENDKKLFAKNKNKNLFCYLLVIEMTSFLFM